MKQHSQPREPSEQALLQHYRDHSQEQPSAELDQFILAAASAALAPATPRPSRSWPVRLQAWLFGEVRPVRWSVAVASLAMVGLGLGLTFKTLEQAPESYELSMPASAPAPSPAAPAPVVAADRAASEAKKSTEVMGGLNAAADAQPVVQAEAASALAEEAAPMLKAMPAPAKPALAERAAKAKARVADAPPAPLEAELLAALQQVLALRKSGQEQEADKRLAVLQLRYPQLDLQAELARLPPVIEPLTEPEAAFKPEIQLPKPPEPEPKAQVSRPARQSPPAKKPPEPEIPLDLSLPEDVLESLPPFDASAEMDSALLPPMFHEEPEENPFQLNGRLITKERQDEIEGAELQIQFKR